MDVNVGIIRNVCNVCTEAGQFIFSQLSPPDCVIRNGEVYMSSSFPSNLIFLLPPSFQLHLILPWPTNEIYYCLNYYGSNI